MRSLIGITFAVLFVGCGTKDSANKPPNNVSAITSAGTPTITHSWREFTAGNPGHFKVNFPWGSPTVRPLFNWSASNVADPQSYSAEQWQKEQTKDKTPFVFQIVVGKFQSKATGSERDKSLEELVTSMRIPAELKRSEPKATTWAGQPAKETIFEESTPQQEKKRRVVVRQFATEKVAYLGLVWDTGDLTEVEVAKFFDSFQLTQAAGSK